MNQLNDGLIDRLREMQDRGVSTDGDYWAGQAADLIASQQSEIDRLTRELAEREKHADAYLAFKDKAADHGCESLIAVFTKLRQLEAAQSASSQPGGGGEPVACKGRNCGATDGIVHSPECFAEHAATICAGRSIGYVSQTGLDNLLSGINTSTIVYAKSDSEPGDIALYTRPQPAVVVLPEEYLCELYRSAYHSGHHDTVEGNYRDLRHGEHLEHLDAVKEFIADKRLNPTATPITAQRLAAYEMAARLVMAVQPSEFGGTFVLDIEGEGNWFDVRRRIEDALSAQEVKS